MPCVFQMVSVQRVTEYRDLKKERLSIYRRKVPPLWPNARGIRFDSVSFRPTSDSPPALKDLTAVIESREEVCLSHLLLRNPAKVLALNLLLPSLSVCQGNSSFLCGCRLYGEIRGESFLETIHEMWISAFLFLCWELPHDD